ncbi:MAG: bifunctional folylpolyglutamate synthase/dihydrofolate synthase [Alphaproteobacteria bacterium]
MISDDLLDHFRTLHPKLIDLSLGRMQRLLKALDHPERKLPPVIHVAGTNGKGSTVAFLRALLEAKGKRVQALTSPHLVRFHERIRLSSGLISEDRLVDVLSRCEAANGGEAITYFEMTTAAAFLACAEDEADFCLVEVGLGGRFDATNVIEAPVATVITPVGYDHQSFLGDTLTEIAHEKAGILKAGIPGFIAPQMPEAKREIERVGVDVGAPLHHCAQREDLPPLGLAGPHQRDNASVAVATLTGLGITLEAEALARGLVSVEWPARLQPIDRGPLYDLLPEGASLWLDGGHNGEAALAIADTFKGRRVHLVVGLMANKDIDAFLSALAPIAASLTAVPIPGESAHDPEHLVQQVSAIGLQASARPDVREALKSLGDGDVLICGSLYLAGQVLDASGLQPT